MFFRRVSIRSVLIWILRQCSGFSYVWIALILFCVPVILLHVLLWPSSLDYLSLSPDRWWALISSAFIHRDLAHLFNNLWAFVRYTVSFVFVNLLGSVERKRYWSKTFLCVSFVGGIIAGGIELLARMPTGWNGTIVGASGIVYSAIGVLFASVLIVSTFYVRIFLTKQGRRLGLRNVADLLLNVLVLVFIVLELITSTEKFLSFSPKAAVYSHSYGFVIGFCISLALFFNFQNKKQ